MAAIIYNTPASIEPLPLYRRDPETASVLSSAPSYVSEAPTYHSRRQSVAQTSSNNTRTNHTRANSSNVAEPTRQRRERNESNTPIGLPPVEFAPGFRNRARPNLNDPSLHTYNMSQWSNTSGGLASRQLHAVARRRVEAGSSISAQNILNSLNASPTATTSANSSVGPSTSPTASSSAVNNTSTDSHVDTSPISPLEDPYLVGEDAAHRARQARIYREMCLCGDQAMKHESKTWDFMLGQMADWDERQMSWDQFKGRVGMGYNYGFGLSGGAAAALRQGRRKSGLKGRLLNLGRS